MQYQQKNRGMNQQLVTDSIIRVGYLEISGIIGKKVVINTHKVSEKFKDQKGSTALGITLYKFSYAALQHYPNCQIMKQVDTLIKDLKLDEFDKYKRPFGIKNSYAIVIFFGLLYAINIIGFWRPFVLIAFGFIYPAQKTAQVYANSKEKSNQWMAYWMITAFLLIFDEYLLVIPFYRSAQPLLLLYLWNPRYNAAENLMNKLIGLSTFSSDPLKKLELSTADKFSLVKDIGKLFKKLE